MDNASTAGGSSHSRIRGQGAARAALATDELSAVTTFIDRDATTIATAVFPPFRASRNYRVIVTYDAASLIYTLDSPRSTQPQYVVIDPIDDHATGNSAPIAINIEIDGSPADNMIAYPIRVGGTSPQMVAWRDFEIGREPVVVLTLTSFSD